MIDIDDLKSDKEDFINYLKENSLNKRIFDDDIISKIGKMHSIIYSILLINKRLKTTKHSRVYLDEILSDYIDIVPLLVSGYNKITKCILRDIIENCLKYIYFYDHPIEFTWLDWKEKYYLFIDDYLKYINDHPNFIPHRDLELTSKIKTKYFELSKYIHSKNKTYMQLRKCLKSIKFDKKFIDEFLSDFITISDLIIMLLLLFTLDRFQKIHIKEKRIILDSLSRSHKRYIQSL